jgi:two-component system cell cycle response regulator
MVFSHCEQFGFDAAKIRERLQWLELGPEDHIQAKRLQQRLLHHSLSHIIDAFYGWLQTLDEARVLLGDDATVARLKTTQAQYLLSLGVGFDQSAYFESRLRVGLAHAWVGLSLSLYQCAYRRMTQLIIDQVCMPTAQPAEEDRALMAFVHKIIALDMSLAIETYHCVQVRSLEESLDRAQLQQDRLRVEASTDSLTGLYNHEHIMNDLNASVPPPQGQGCAVVMADIDHFKDINDSYGHLVGDKVLMEVARRLRAALRDFDSLGRYGGEEFLIILRNATLPTAQAVAERVRSHVGAGPINLQGLEVAVTISLGVSAIKPGDDVEAILSRADHALYQAKDGGRNRVEVII